jgi:hypothetical protein
LEEQHKLQVRKALIEAAVITTGSPGAAEEKIISLAAVKTYLNTSRHGSFIPTDGPLPADLLPISISRHFSPDSLQSAFGWRELTIVEWLRYILDDQIASSDIEHDVTRSPQWAERVLQALARAWPNCSKKTKADFVILLGDKTCIPTSAGLKIPNHAYFQNTNVFPDLPIVTLSSRAPIKGALEELLQELGVRKHVDLQIVFHR